MWVEIFRGVQKNLTCIHSKHTVGRLLIILSQWSIPTYLSMVRLTEIEARDGSIILWSLNTNTYCNSYFGGGVVTKGRGKRKQSIQRVHSRTNDDNQTKKRLEIFIPFFSFGECHAISIPDKIYPQVVIGCIRIRLHHCFLIIKIHHHFV